MKNLLTNRKKCAIIVNVERGKEVKPLFTTERKKKMKKIDKRVTKYVVLDTGEVLKGSTTVEDNKAVNVTSNGTIEVEPSDGYDSMAKATLTVDVNSKLYAWSRTDSGDTFYVYTLTETPTTASKAYYANPDSGTDNVFQILNQNVGAIVSDSVITVDGENYTRAIAADITL